MSLEILCRGTKKNLFMTYNPFKTIDSNYARELFSHIKVDIRKERTTWESGIHEHFLALHYMVSTFNAFGIFGRFQLFLFVVSLLSGVDLSIAME